MSASKTNLIVKDFSVTGETFELRYEKERDLWMTEPAPKNLDKYYASDDYISHTDAKRNFLEVLYASIKRRNLRNKTQVIDNQRSKQKRLLDFGAGTGDFVKFAQQSGFDSIALEPNALASEKARQKGLTVFNSLEQIKDRSFNVITLWHVLEHLPNLISDIESLLSLLEDDGLLVIAVPNYKSWDAQHYKNHWAGYDVPRHLWHFSRTSIQTIFEKQHCQVIKEIPMRYDAFYVSLLSEKYRGNFLRMPAAFLKGFYSNVHAMFTGEYSSIIYLIQKKLAF
ncbi:MAG: class I SAM-dependent methyltransferase [Bacteroidota bacterium]